MENPISYELVNPEGTVIAGEGRLNPHPGTLEGKTILLRWNGKHNGDIFLNRTAELLTETVKNLRILKSWEVVPETASTSQNPETSIKRAEKLAALKPDIVIASQGD